MKNVNEIAIARKAIRKAIAAGVICPETSGMHKIGFDAIASICVNHAVASELAWVATLDVKFGR